MALERPCVGKRARFSFKHRDNACIRSTCADFWRLMPELARKTSRELEAKYDRQFKVVFRRDPGT